MAAADPGQWVPLPTDLKNSHFPGIWLLNMEGSEEDFSPPLNLLPTFYLFAFRPDPALDRGRIDTRGPRVPEFRAILPQLLRCWLFRGPSGVSLEGVVGRGESCLSQEASPSWSLCACLTAALTVGKGLRLGLGHCV